MSASDLGIGTGGLGPQYGSGLNTSGGGSMNNSSLHQSSVINILLILFYYLINIKNIFLCLIKYVIKLNIF